MKKKLLFYLAGAALTLSAFSSCSCSGRSGEDLLERVPADAGYVILAQTRQAMESADVTLNEEGNTITLPDYITTAFPQLQDAVANANETLQDNGIDISAVALFGYFECADATVIVAKLGDVAKADASFREEYQDVTDAEGGVTVYSTTDADDYGAYQSCSVIADGYVYTCSGWYGPNSDSPKDVVLKAMSAAKEKPFPKLGVASAMAGYNLGACAISTAPAIDEVIATEPALASVAEKFRGYMLIGGNADGSEADVEIALVDNDGDVKSWPELPELKLGNKEMQGMYDFTADISNNRAPFNAEVLRYLPSDVNLTLGVNMGDLNWADVIDDLRAAGALSRDDAAALRMVSVFLNSFKGSLAFGIGYNGTIAQLLDDSEQAAIRHLSAALVVETKPGKAQQTVADLQQLCGQFGDRSDCRATANGLEIGLDLPDTTMTISITAADDMLIIANRPFAGPADNAVTRSIDVGKSPSLFALALDANSAIVKELGMQGGITVYAAGDIDKARSKLVVKGTSTKEKIFPMLVKCAVGVADNPELLQAFVTDFNNFENSEDFENFEDFEDYDF